MRRSRLTSLLSVATLAVVATSFAQAQESSAPRAVRDLAYGNFLYHYFQDQPLQALTTAAIADANGGFQGHGQYPRLIEGGIRLQFGLDESAEQIFNALLDSNASAQVRNRAWFYLARIAYQRQQFARAEQLLHKVDPNKLVDSHGDYLLLLSNIAVRLNKHSEAVAISERFAVDAPLLPYAQYNAGVAWQKRISAGDTPALLGGNLWQYAAAQFVAAADSSTRLARWEAHHADEYLALADRANLAAGYVLLGANQYENAINHFRAVRLEGPYASDAMLGYGWAATEAEQYQLALTPWQHLSQRPLINAAVQESYLALPYIYEKLGAPAQALAQYERAAVAYSQEIKRLDQAIDAFERIDIAETFIETLSEGPVNWIRADYSLDLKPHSPYLTQLLANHGFHAMLMDWQDLQRLRRDMASWQEKLDTYSDLSSSWQQRQSTLAELNSKDFEVLLQRLGARREILLETLKQVRRQRDFTAVLPPEEHAAASQLTQSEQRLQSLQAAGVDMADAEQRLRFLRGLMQWQAADNFKLNVRQQQRALQALDQQIQALRQRLGQVGQATRLSNNTVAEERLAHGQQRLQQTLVALDTGIQALEEAMREQAASTLVRQRENIVSYLAQVRVSITRLYDLSAQRNGELD